MIDVKSVMQNVSLQYTLISMSAVFAGFLFTGMGIFVSTLEKERISRLWKHNYLDNLYKAAFVGMATDVIMLLLALSILIFNIGIKYKIIFAHIEIIALINGIVAFIWCTKELAFVIAKTKNTSSK